MAAPAVLSVALGAALLTACQSGHTAALPATTTTTVAQSDGQGSSASTTATTTTSTSLVSPTSQPATTATTATTATFAAVTGTYYGGTAGAGWLYIRADGASRYRYPDEAACQCSTATAPIANVDFSLTNLVATAGGKGHYRATGHITAESDPATGKQLAGPVGSSVTVNIGPAGSATVSFLLPNNVLKIPNAGA